METQKIKWDSSMAVRCLAKLQNEKRVKKILTEKPEVKKTEVPVKTGKEKELTVNIPKGEWDDFQHALSATIKKKHK
jgi:hypothetical protein